MLRAKMAYSLLGLSLSLGVIGYFSAAAQAPYATPSIEPTAAFQVRDRQFLELISGTIRPDVFFAPGLM